MTTMEPTQRTILDLIAAKGEMVLSGNKESFSYLQYRNRIWLHVVGDAMTQDTETHQVTPEQALQMLSSKVRERTDHYGPDRGEVTWPDVLSYFQAGRF